MLRRKTTAYKVLALLEEDVVGFGCSSTSAALLPDNYRRT